jgi:hypothetical protein
MRGNNRLINLVLFISMSGVLTLAAHGYAVCWSDQPDACLELTMAYQTPSWPVFTPNLTSYLLSMSPVRVFCFQKADLETTTLRC